MGQIIFDQFILHIHRSLGQEEHNVKKKLFWSIDPLKMGPEKGKYIFVTIYSLFVCLSA
jgi:hypothetical protein